MNFAKISIALAAAALCCEIGAAQATSYTNAPDILTNPIPYSGTCCVSPGNFLGEIFTNPTAGTLTDLTFYTSGPVTAGNLDFIIADWTASIPSATNFIGGVPIPTAPVFSSVVAFATTNQITPIKISGINLNLAAGQTFVAYFSANGVANPATVPLAGIGATGGFEDAPVYCFFCGPTLNPNAVPWWGPGAANLAFGANVAAVPEPETYALMLAGLGMMGFMVRRRNHTLA